MSELKIRVKTSYQHYFSPFCVKGFVKSIRSFEEKMRVIFKRNLKVNMSEEIGENFENAEKK